MCRSCPHHLVGAGVLRIVDAELVDGSHHAATGQGDLALTCGVEGCRVCPPVVDLGRPGDPEGPGEGWPPGGGESGGGQQGGAHKWTVCLSWRTGSKGMVPTISQKVLPDKAERLARGDGVHVHSSA